MYKLKELVSIISILFIVLLSLSGCKKSQTEDTTADEYVQPVYEFMDSNSTITLYTGTKSIIADGNTSLFIFAEIHNNSGSIIADGLEITFSTTAGDINPIEDGVQDTALVTTSNGIAKTTLTSSTHCESATITASIEGITAHTAVDFIAGSPCLLEIEATPTDLSSDGISQSAITIKVVDAYNNPVADGTLVSINAEGGGVSSHIAETIMGIAEVTYTAPQSQPLSGIDTLSVQVAGGVHDSIDITLSESPDNQDIQEYEASGISSICLSTGAKKIFADGNTSILVYAEIKDSHGVYVTDDTEVTFTTTAGDIDSATPGIQDNVVVTTTNGGARTYLTSSTNPGTATVIVSARGTIMTATVDFIPGPPCTLTVEAIPIDLLADGKSQSTIITTVLDAHRNPVADGTLITFDPIEGSLSSHIARTSEGVAKVTYTVPHFQLPSGYEEISARTTNGETGSVHIKLRGPQIAGILLTADPETLPADGLAKTIIRAYVSFEGGENVPDGTLVDFEIIKGGGSLEGDTVITTKTVQGIAEAQLTSGNHVETSTIKASTGNRVAEIQVSYIPGSVSLAITPNSLLGTGDQVAKVIATLSTVSGTSPPDGETVIFALSDDSYGYFTDLNGQNITDSEGIVGTIISEGTAPILFHASTQEGEVTITATWRSTDFQISRETSVKIQPSPADIELAQGFPDPPLLNVKGTGGAATSLLTFDVIDERGEPVSNGYRIDFSIIDGPNGGELLIPSSTRTANGQVTTILRSGCKSGPVSIKAAYHNDYRVNSISSVISISAGPPVGEEFGIAADSKNIAGFWEAYLKDLITVGVGDVYGNAIPDKTAISFKTYNTGGFFEPGSSVTTDGLASSILVSSFPKPLQGFVSVTAEAINGGRTTRVTSLAVTPSPDNHIIYAGTNGGGVYKSIDGGASWKNMSRSSNEINWGQNWIDPYINDIAIDSDCSNIVYAATGYLGKGNVYRSLDGGLNWNSNNIEEWYGIFNTEQNGHSILTILCDGDDDPETDYPYVWIGTNGLGALYSSDGKNFEWGGIVKPEGNTKEDPDSHCLYFNINKGRMTIPTLSSYSKTETWTVFYEEDYWVVVGSVSGPQRGRAETSYTNSSLLYESDNKEVSFYIYQGEALFTQGDCFEFQIIESNLGYGKVVRDIVKVPGTHGENAILYAGTPYGVFKSTGLNNGGRVWDKLSSFTGNSIATLEIHPESDGTTDILYAGTEDAGVWMSIDSGITWTRYSEGISKGCSVSIPLPSPGNKGNGMMKDITVGSSAQSEKWTVTYKGEGLFNVSASTSGPQNDAHLGVSYTSNDASVSFTILKGSLNFELGDSFMFTTMRDTGSNIKDLLVDAVHNKLYAVTYFWGATDPHAVGNVYVHELTDIGAMTNGAWHEQNNGLPQYDPPDDLSLCAEHVLALDNDNDPRIMYIGGEGINLYRSNIGSELSWQESKSGITNCIMSRMPILFSGECIMDVKEYRIPPDGLTFYYTVYIQDINGNPPVEGSRFIVTHYRDWLLPTRDTVILLDKEYSDVYIEEGTFRDPADPKTNNPYTFKITPTTSEDKVSFIFTPATSHYPDPPGSSGSEQTLETGYDDYF
ncbi:MAG: invasin domain 3-containing protein [bacterium]